MDPATLKTGLSVIERQLQPCGSAAVGEILAPLMLCTVRRGEEGLTIVQVQGLMMAELELYQHKLGKVPHDILAIAVDQHSDRSKFWPMPAELLELAQPLIDQRHRHKKRIEDMKRAASKPAESAVPFRPSHVRTQELIDIYRKHGNHVRADKLEGELVTTAQRHIADHRAKGLEPEEWASEIAKRVVAVHIEPLLPPPTPPPTRPATFTDLVVQEEPPLPDQIPE